MKKIICVLISTMMIIGLMPLMSFADAGLVDRKDVSTIAFIADAHNQKSNNSAERTTEWLAKVCSAENDLIDIVGDCGDIGDAWNYLTFWNDAGGEMDALDNSEYVKASPSLHIAGNHEWLNGNVGSSTNTNAKRIIKETGIGYSSDEYEIFCIPALSSSQEITKASINKLNSYLSSANSKKTIFIIAHYPLHDDGIYGGTENSSEVIETINKYADRKNITFIWGHNHTKLDHNYFYDEIATPGTKLDGQTIKFNYASAGVMSDSSDYSDTTSKIKAKGLVATVNNVTGKTTLKFYKNDGTAFGETVIRKGVKAKPVVTNKTVTYSSKTGICSGTISIKDKYGRNLATKTYSVSNPGEWSISFKGNDDYLPAKATFKVAIKKTAIKKLAKGKKSFTVKVGKLSKYNATGYQVRYSRKSNMSNANIKTISTKYNKVSKKISKLKKKTKYYVQVRSYKKIGNKKYYSEWSATKAIKT